jgi:hypothetical protein
MNTTGPVLRIPPLDGEGMRVGWSGKKSTQFPHPPFIGPC